MGKNKKKRSIVQVNKTKNETSNKKRKVEAPPTSIITQVPKDDKPKTKKETEPKKSAKDIQKVEYPHQIFSENWKSKSIKQMFEWLIYPVDVDTFFSKYWEKKPLVIHRNNPDYYKELNFTKEAFLQHAKEETLVYGRNVNVVKFEDGFKVDYNKQDESASENQLKDFWDKGCTLQVLHPQQYSDEMWKVVSYLEDFFGVLIGANSYITPNDAQGLAPHYDDVEVFITQLEGEKHWRLHKPDLSLPRKYSNDFQSDEIGDPFKKVTLNQGDFLYFPRGTIHHALVESDSEEIFSHHMTISAYQQNSWFDYLNTVIPDAIQSSFIKDEEFRKGLPVNCLSYMGLAFQQKNQNQQREEFKKKCTQLFNNLLKQVNFDQGIDERTTDFIAHRILPYSMRDDLEPKLPKPDSDDIKIRLINPNWIRVAKDKSLELQKEFEDVEDPIINTLQSIQDIQNMQNFEDSESDDDSESNSNYNKDGKDKEKEKDFEMIDMDSEDDFSEENDNDITYLLFHCLKNSRENHMDGQHEVDPACLKFPDSTLPGIQFLFKSYPNFVRVADLPLPKEENIEFLSTLWNECLLQTKTK